MYEATVGAGLPVLSTLKNLLDTGDRVVSIEGILSGTLSYLFNSYKQGDAFSAVVAQAKALGYTEPDPRDDLSGTQVWREGVPGGQAAQHQTNSCSEAVWTSSAVDARQRRRCSALVVAPVLYKLLWASCRLLARLLFAFVAGADVARKVVILARECGLQVGLEDLQVSSLVPQPLQALASADEFMQQLPQVRVLRQALTGLGLWVDAA
jgi:hypothetical protein